MKILVSVLFLFCFSLAESKSFLDNKLRNAATDDLYNNDDSYEYEYEYEDIDEGNMFECLDGSGSKVILDYMCNGYRDCEDGSDEDIVNCAVHGITVTKTSTTSTTTTTTIPPPTTTSTTIKSLKIKEPDEFDDYEDACSTDEFQCKSDLGICLPKALVCDGTHDCPNGEDETDCPTGNLKPEYIAPLMSPEAGNSDVDTSEEFDHNDGVDVKARPSSLDYSRFYDSRKGSAIHHPPALPTVPKPQVAFPPQPPVVLMKPEPEKPAIFVPDLQPETDEDNLSMESEYHYVIIDEYGDYKEFGDADSVTESPADKQSTTAAEIISVKPSPNSVELVKNMAENFGEKEPTPSTEEGKDVIIRHHGPAQENRKSDVSLSSSSVQSQQTDLMILEKENTESFVKRRKKIDKQRKKVRGVVGQLLHQVGKLIENEDYSSDNNGESSNNPRMHTNIGIDLGLGSNQANDLYSRILSSCSSKTRLRISIDLDL